MSCEVVSSQILGGRLAELYGFKKVRKPQIQQTTNQIQIYGVGTLLPGILMFFHPIAARTDVSQVKRQKYLLLDIKIN